MIGDEAAHVAPAAPPLSSRGDSLRSCDLLSCTDEEVAAFRERGYWIGCPKRTAVCEAVAAESANRLKRLLKKDFDLGRPPTKVPIYDWESLQEADKRKKATLQIINCHHADALLRSIVLDPRLGELVCQLAGWSGARVAQDQAWIKPPNSGGLSFHRDSTYFDFSPDDVVTVWIAFDYLSDVDRAKAMGALEYCAGSHKWGDRRSGFSKQFFNDHYRDLLHSAASLEGLAPEELSVERVTAKAGGVAVHDGRTWHGSGPNTTAGFRHGIGIHFIPKDVVWRTEKVSPLYSQFKTEGSLVVSDEAFPVTWPPAKVPSASLPPETNDEAQ